MNPDPDPVLTGSGSESGSESGSGLFSEVGSGSGSGPNWSGSATLVETKGNKILETKEIYDHVVKGQPSM